MAFLIQKSFGDITAGANLTGTALIRMISGDRLRIGRGAGCDLRLTDPGVGLEHAELRQIEGGLEVVDLGSTTGTFLNGRQVQKAAAKSGDWVEIGRTRISLEYGSGSLPVLLNVRELEEEPARPAGGAAAAAVEGKARAPVAQIDYVAIYRLASRFVDKRSLSVLGLAAATLALGWLVWTGRLAALRPGGVSQSHASLGAKCFACHAPWSGPAEDRCVTCHAGPEHQAIPASAPAGATHASGEPMCTACHLEHRFADRLATVTNELCVDCHADLGRAGAMSGRFERAITDFASDHPEFTVAAVDDQGRVERRRLAGDEVVSDPTRLRMRHQLHLSPDRWSPKEKKVQLHCQDCHAFDAATGEIAPLRFEDHCQRCHALDFDPRVGPAPHATGEEVHAFLLARYVALENPAAAAPLPQRRGRLLPRQPVSGRPPSRDISLQVIGQVTRAEYTLFRDGAHCARCHVTTEGTVVPGVEPPDRPRPWFFHGRFTHAAHRMRECEACHSRSRASDRTEDILIPGIELCRACHGPDTGVVAAGGAGVETGPGATTRCVSCHTYHDKSKLGWEAMGAVAANSSASEGRGGGGSARSGS